MFETVSEHNVPDPSHFERHEEVMIQLSEGDVLHMFVSGENNTYEVEMAVSSVRTCSSKVDDVAVGSIDSSPGELRLSWCPAEPNVGIENPYPEPPLQLEYDNSTYEVTTINVK